MHFNFAVEKHFHYRVGECEWVWAKGRNITLTHPPTPTLKLDVEINYSQIEKEGLFSIFGVKNFISISQVVHLN